MTANRGNVRERMQVPVKYIKIARVMLLMIKLAAPGSKVTIDQEERDRARRYNRQKEQLFLVGLLISWVAGAIFVFSGLAAKVRRAAGNLAGRGLKGQSLAVVFYALLSWLASLPLSFYSGFVLEHRYDLSHQTVPAWLWDHLKGLGLGLGLEVPGADLAYAVIRRWPQTWWAILTALSLPFTVLLAQLYPVLIAPIFNKFEPVRNEQLVERLKTLAAKSGIQVAGVMQMDMSRRTKKANAFFAGLGPTKRIVLADTLIDNFTPEEIEVIVAHEMGHQVHRDIWRGIAIGTLFTFAGSYILDRIAGFILRRFGGMIGVSKLDNVATLPLLGWILSVVGIVLMPIQNAYSRYIEREADTYALQLTDDPEAFASAMERLAALNLADPNPPTLVKYFLYSHPPIIDRVDHAREFARDHDLPVPEPMRAY